jgi:uncharacterized damage-inducible protein DinB
VADLLECLVQIRALGETPARLRRLAALAPEAAWCRRPGPQVWAPLEVLAHLADAELFLATRLRLVLTGERPTLEVWNQNALAARSNYLAWPLERTLARFCQLREANLELLATCDATDLARVGVHRTRGPVTVADLVAHALAHDTAHGGQIRTRLGLAGPD